MDEQNNGNPDWPRRVRTVVWSLCAVIGLGALVSLDAARPTGIQDGPEDIRRGMDRAQVRRAAGDPLKIDTMRERNTWILETWTYRDRRVFFLNGYVRSVVSLK